MSTEENKALARRVIEQMFVLLLAYQANRLIPEHAGAWSDRLSYSSRFTLKQSEVQSGGTSHMLASSFIAVAILLRLMSDGGYLISTLRGKAKPNIVSWSLWGLTALIALAAQICKDGGCEILVTLAIAAGPLAVTAAAVLKGGQSLRLTRLDVWCLSLAIVGIILWVKMKDPLLALLMSIVADIFASMPTVVKSYLTPHTESAAAYSLSVISMIVTLLTVRQWNVMSWAFPLYILAINLTLAGSAYLAAEAAAVPAVSGRTGRQRACWRLAL